jgi:hypothetical protein
MSAATFLTATKMVDTFLPETFTIMRKTVKVSRFFSTFLINIWFFPVPQINDPSERALHESILHMDPVMYLWWYGYSLGLAVRSLQPLSGSFSPTVERVGLGIAGSIQGVVVSKLLKRYFETVSSMRHRRKITISVSAVAWIMDTLDFFTGYIPKPFRKPIAKTVSVFMVTSYELRAHLMMALGVVGICKSSLLVAVSSSIGTNVELPLNSPQCLTYPSFIYRYLDFYNCIM